MFVSVQYCSLLPLSAFIISIIYPLPVFDCFFGYVSLVNDHSTWVSSNPNSSFLFFILCFSMFTFLMFVSCHKVQIISALTPLFSLCRNERSPCSGWWACDRLASPVPGLASQWHTASPHADSQRVASLPQEHYQHQARQESIHRSWWHEDPLQHVHCEWDCDVHMANNLSMEHTCTVHTVSTTLDFLFPGMSPSADSGSTDQHFESHHEKMFP